MEIPAARPEHRWLQRLAGDWTFESECSMGPGQPPMKSSGKESVRKLGELWAIGQGQGSMPGGGESHSVMTLGYDPTKKRFVGTFIASVMTHLWVYDGCLSETGKALILDTDGPSFLNEGTMGKYQDIIEFVNDDHRMLSSQLLGPDGTWIPFMKAHYHRVL